MNVLAELVVGLSYLRADNPEKALTYLSLAESDPHWPNVDGKEFAYLLKGHALMRLASVNGATDAITESLAAYDAALAIKPEYTRAQLGRAGALAMLSVAVRGEDGRRRLDRDLLAQSEAAYRAVLDRAAGMPAMEVSTARTGLGYVYLTSGLYGRAEDFERARPELLQVTAEYEGGDEDLARDIRRNAGVAYGYLGLLARQTGDPATAVVYYERALDLVAPVSRSLYLLRLSELACQQGDHAAAVELNGRAVDEARLYGRAADVDDYTRRLAALQASGCP
jgi:tetratricopeptide (TPR) repeat protein